MSSGTSHVTFHAISHYSRRELRMGIPCDSPYNIALYTMGTAHWHNPKAYPMGLCICQGTNVPHGISHRIVPWLVSWENKIRFEAAATVVLGMIAQISPLLQYVIDPKRCCSAVSFLLSSTVDFRPLSPPCLIPLQRRPCRVRGASCSSSHHPRTPRYEYHLRTIFAALVHSMASASNPTRTVPCAPLIMRSETWHWYQFFGLPPGPGFSPPDTVANTMIAAPAKKSHRLRVAVSMLPHWVFLRALAY